MVHVLIGYIHSQRIIDQATEGIFTAPLGIPAQLFGMGYPKFAGRAALSALLFQGVMVQLTISLPGSFSQPCGGGGCRLFMGGLPFVPLNALLVAAGVASLCAGIPRRGA